MAEESKKKVLIVEDEKEFLFILSQSVVDAGLNVATAGDGEEGLAVAKEEKPDLILLDITMPKMDGITMAKKLKDEGIKTPIIFLTNMKDDAHISEAMEAVPKTEYIIKSDLSIESIVARIKVKLNIK